MAQRRTGIAVGITIASIALVFVITIIVGWNIIFPFYYQATYLTDPEASRVGLWVIMAIGDVFLVVIMVAIAFFLASMIRRSFAMRRQLNFIDTITHELKTPLTSLSLSLETFQRRQLSEEVREKMVKRMDQDVKRLTHFIQHVIAANRLEHGERDLNIIPCDCNALITECRQRIIERYELESEQLRLVLPNEPVQVLADSFALESIILNLMDNAVKYSTKEILVECSLIVYDEEYCLAISDKGIGLSPTDIKQLFKRFSRVSNLSHISGSGLGLFLIDSLAKKMNMLLRVQSDGHGYGSTFFLHMPRTPVS